MSLNLFQFHHPEDGWAEVLTPWLASASQRVLAGEDVWFISPHRLAAHWVRQRWASAGHPWFGIRTLEPWSLRRELAARLGVPYQPLGRESLELLLTLLASTDLANNPLAHQVAISPGSALRALDELGRAGWRSTDQTLKENPLAPWLAALEKTDGWLPALDDQLLAASRPARARPLHLLFWSWDSDQAADWKLLPAAIRQATSAVLAAPTPRFDGRDNEQHWLDLLSQNLSQPVEVCPRSADPSEQTPTPCPLPTASLSTATDSLIASLRPSIQQGLRTAILLEPDSPLAPRLRTRLRELGIPFYDDLGTPRPTSPAWAARSAWITYHATDGSLPAFLDLWASLVHGLGQSHLTAPVLIEHSLRRALDQAQTTRLPLLLSHPGATLLRQQIGPLAPHLELWPQTLTWDETVARLKGFDQAIGIDSTQLEPLVGRLKRILGSSPLNRSDLLRFLQVGLHQGGVLRQDNENQPFTPLTLTSRQAARGQTWHAILFTDANEGVWPRTPFENPFLPETLRARLNRHAAHSIARLPTARDRAAAERDQTARLIEAATAPATLLYLTHDPDDPQQKRFPNEIVARFAAGRAPLLSPLPPGQNAPVQPTELARFARIHSERRNPHLPLDEWFWTIGPVPGQPPPWTPSSLDKLRRRPATFLLEWFHRARRSWGQPWKRTHHAAIGTLAHQWLASVLEGAVHPTEPELLEKLRAARLASQTTMPDDPFWHGVFREAWLYTRAMASAIPGLGSDAPLQTEVKAQTINLQGTGLALVGKADLIIQPGDGQSCHIIDFKTGKGKSPPTCQQMLKPDGKGLQFAAYLWLFADKAREVKVSMIDREGTCHPVLSRSDAPALQPVLDELARVYHSGCFAQGSFADLHNHDGEELPFACPPFSKNLLTSKREAFLSNKDPASNL